MLHDGFWITEFLEFGHPFFYVFQLRIEFFCLERRIEDAEVRRCIAAAARGPLPIAVIGCQVEVEQLSCKISFAPSPVDQSNVWQEMTQ